MIRPEVSKRISLLTDFLHSVYSEKYAIDLERIVDDEGILVHYDDYENAFDGMFVIDGGKHHIHLNTARGNYKQSGRGRFSLAHELGHYLIDEHHTDIRTGKLKPHPSFLKNSQIDIYEAEADHFAANLLMPEEKFYNACGGRKFNWNLIEDLARKFKSSKFATLLRFTNIIRHEIFIIGSEKSIIKWFIRNDDFPKMKHKFKRGEKLPQTALANMDINGVSKVVDAYSGDWFETWGGKSERQLYEQCYFAEAYNQKITLLWFL
ncbi:MAG: ImmA/IrrE family metallo-endopeptidase [Bacteroidales bacterium]|nr:ImmA/IrrE family metallo-endopeptidase [Bacteroidales bacterium]